MPEVDKLKVPSKPEIDGNQIRRLVQRWPQEDRDRVSEHASMLLLAAYHSYKKHRVNYAYPDFSDALKLDIDTLEDAVRELRGNSYIEVLGPKGHETSLRLTDYGNTLAAKLCRQKPPDFWSRVGNAIGKHGGDIASKVIKSLIVGGIVAGLTYFYGMRPTVSSIAGGIVVVVVFVVSRVLKAKDSLTP